METIAQFIQSHRLYFDAAQALSSVVNLIGWCAGAIFLAYAWRSNKVSSFAVGPFSIRMQEEAVEAAASAARNWQSPSKRLDVSHIRQTIARAFSQDVADNLTGKAILWVDDNLSNNELAVRALRKLFLDVEQATSTQAGLEAMARRRFDLVISDMGRGEDMRAGYGLLAAIRNSGNKVPFLIFASVDKPEFRAEAKAAGAQLSTNDMLELIDTVVATLGK